MVEDKKQQRAQWKAFVETFKLNKIHLKVTIIRARGIIVVCKFSSVVEYNVSLDLHI